MFGIGYMNEKFDENQNVVKHFVSVDGNKLQICLNEKHNVGVIMENGKISVDYKYDPIERVFHSGFDPLDVDLSFTSKKEFIQWWKLRTSAFPIKTVKGVVDSGKMIRMTKDGIDIVGATMSVSDATCEQFPFHMNNVDSFQLVMPELHSFNNTPRKCKIAQYGARYSPMQYLDTLVGSVVEAKSLSVYTHAPFLNLETSLTTDIEDLTISTPYFASFEGLNVNVTTLTLETSEQKSFNGIHKGLNQSLSNVCRIRVAFTNTSSFCGGVLPFAMLDPSIEVIADITGYTHQEFCDAMGVVTEQRKRGTNVHDIQELLIDKGLSKYARL